MLGVDVYYMYNADPHFFLFYPSVRRNVISQSTSRITKKHMCEYQKNIHLCILARMGNKCLYTMYT